MGLWAFYFLAKTYLFFRGYIYLDFILNILFVVFLIIPIPQSFRYHKALSDFRTGIGLVLGFLLLWHDSWLPPLSETMDFIQTQSLPTEYIHKFLLESVNFMEVAVLGLLLGFCILVRHHLTLIPLVLVLLLVVPLRDLKQDKGEMERYLDFFYQSESRRVISFERPQSGSPPFDIILLHICSLAWQDLKDIDMQNHPFFKQFDILLTNFNTVTSYTNPSAIRLLRANCGQGRHADLYRDTETECYLFDTLRFFGYETYFTLNHDGRFGDFAGQVSILGHLDPPLQWIDLPIQQYNFDGSPIYDNYAVLKKSWEVRQESKASRVALYHNNISLHDGAYWAGEENWWKRGRVDHYREFVDKLFNDLKKFFDLLSDSGRNVVVIFVPEHGSALSGSKLQVAGLRDIPLPQITLVPVGIRLIGTEKQRDPTAGQVVSKPTSFLTLADILASFLRESPFGGGIPEDIIATLPQTDFLAENQGARVVKKGNDYLLEGRSLSKRWIRLSSGSSR
jgi:cellulose synthase operon protein YhjU